MGTPLRGSPLAKYGKHLAFVAQACQKSPNSQLVDSLRTDSHILEVLRENFEKVRDDDRLTLACFYEQYQTSIPIVGSKHVSAPQHQGLFLTTWRLFRHPVQGWMAKKSRKWRSQEITEQCASSIRETVLDTTL